MALIQGLSQIAGYPPASPIPGSSNFFYKNRAFIHIEDLRRTPGRMHTYANMTATLRGVGEYMTENNSFETSWLTVWDVGQPGRELQVGSGAVGLASAEGSGSGSATA